jgi:hypothetical protein
MTRSRYCVEPSVDARTRSAIDTLDALDEHVLQQAVRFVGVGVVVTLPDVSNFLERPVAHHLAGFPKCLERVFGLTRHRDVGDESAVVTCSGSVSKIARYLGGGSGSPCSDAGFSTELRLVLLEHALMLAHMGNVVRAQISEAGIVGLFLVVLERCQKSRVLSGSAIHLAFEKGVPAFHRHLSENSIVDQV